MSNDNYNGLQIDMIIDRRDNIVNLCEIKYYSSVYKIDKDAYLNLINKNNNLKKHLNKKQGIMNVLIKTYGLKQNEYSNVYSHVITLEDLIK